MTSDLVSPDRQPSSIFPPTEAPANLVDDAQQFDFEAHAAAAVAKYRTVLGQYEDYATLLESLIRTFARGPSSPVQFHTLESRAKTVDSFARKAAKPSAENPNAPKYTEPLSQITDLAGVRIITFFLEDVPAFEELINKEFEVIEKTDKSDLLEKEERLGYHSVHYIVSLGDQRLTLPEYSRFRGLKAEIQVRTILQHAWAEIEHDVQYKGQQALPAQIRRRFMTLAGLLEIADREFQEIQEEDARLRRNAKKAVESGNLSQVEITSEALKAYLDRKYGPDGRMTSAAYGYTARLLHRLGFIDLDQVEAAIRGYDDDQVSRLLTNTRQGQLTRLDLVLLAALGQHYIENHPMSRDGQYRQEWQQDLEKLQHAGIEVGRGLHVVRPPTSR
jgi:ppGpp synthetase/RelA/SpoT-type nucleotidyltranferase